MEQNKTPEETTQANAPAPTPMQQKNNNSLSLAIAFSGILIAGAIVFTNNQAPAVAVPAQVAPGAQGGPSAVTPDAPVALLQLKSDDHVLGNANADIVAIEYSDAQCPFCKQFHQTMIQAMTEYGKTKQVAWVYRHFPLDQIHPYARKGGEALECANELGGNDAFWKMEDKIFSPDTQSIAEDQLPLLAKAIGLDQAKFTSCLSSGKWAARVQRDETEGSTIGVRGTPYTILWNRKTGKQIPVTGAYPYATVKNDIVTLLGSAAGSATPPPTAATN